MNCCGIPRGAEISLSAPTEVKPRHFRAIKDGRELRLDELPAQRAARGEHVQDFEFSLVFDDGTIRHVLGYGTPLLDEQGRPRGAVHVLVDITERKRAEEALREREERFSSVLENMSEGLMLFDVHGNAMYQNPASLRILGFGPEEDERIKHEDLPVDWKELGHNWSSPSLRRVACFPRSAARAHSEPGGTLLQSGNRP